MNHKIFRTTSLLLALGCRTAPDSGNYPGTIEVDESDAAPMVTGRVVEVRVHEGDTVRVADTLALLTRADLPPAVEQRRAQLAAARARLADLQRGSRAPELEKAEADLAAAESEATRTATDLTRIQRLAATGVVAAQELDRAKAAAETAARRRDAARAALELAREGSRSDQITAAEAEVRSAEALLEGARADLGELAVLSAVDGVVLSRNADPGEVIAAGIPVATIGVVSGVWVRVYLPANLVNRLATGAAASISARDQSGKAVSTQGRLASVSPKAEFTPRAALTEEERADLLFAARVELVNPPSTFRPGLPVTVRFDHSDTP